MAYSFFITVTTDNTLVAGDESDFPILFRSTVASLRTVGNGGNIQNTDATGGVTGSLTVPADLVFSPNTDGSSPYDFEITAYDATTGALTAFVKIPSLTSAVPNVFYVVYGDAAVVVSQEDIANTWSNSYTAVWHLTNHLLDSTGITGTQSNTGATGSATGGKIAGYYEFGGGESDYMNVNVAAVDTFGVTIESWGRVVDTNFGFQASCMDKDNSNHIIWNNMAGHVGGDPINAFMHNYGAAGGGGNALSAAGFASLTWTYTTTTFTSTILRGAFVDGGNEGTDATVVGAMTGHNDRTAIGAARDSTPTYSAADTRVEEVRFSTVVRSDNWISTSFNAMDDPGIFYSLSGESGTVPRPGVAMLSGVAMI